VDVQHINPPESSPSIDAFYDQAATNHRNKSLVVEGKDDNAGVTDASDDHAKVKRPSTSMVGGGGGDGSGSEKMTTPPRQPSPVSAPSSAPLTYKAAHLFWRFLPDFFSVTIGIIMSRMGLLKVNTTSRVLAYILLPVFFITHWTIMLLQKGDARRNISHFLLETYPFTTWGYCSYPIYLFQRAAFAFYAPYFYFASTSGDYRWRRTDVPALWFETRSLGWKLIGVLALTLVCWFTQKFIQDKLVTAMYAKIMQLSSSSSSSSSPLSSSSSTSAKTSST
jgi:hypothetical protein